MAFTQYAGKGRSIGRMIYYIHHLVPLHVAESCLFEGGGRITFGRAPLATVVWAGTGEEDIDDYPVFHFFGDFAWANEVQLRKIGEIRKEEIQILKDRIAHAYRDRSFGPVRGALLREIDAILQRPTKYEEHVEVQQETLALIKRQGPVEEQDVLCEIERALTQGGYFESFRTEKARKIIQQRLWDEAITAKELP